MWMNVCVPVARNDNDTIDSFADKLQDALGELRNYEEIVTVDAICRL